MVDIKKVYLEIDTAIACGLIINELVPNALKFAFPDGRSGEIKITLFSTAENEMEMSVIDDGI